MAPKVAKGTVKAKYTAKATSTKATGAKAAKGEAKGWQDVQEGQPLSKLALVAVKDRVKALAKVSATPGHTQRINFFTVGPTWTLVDLPGYGYALKARTERDRFQQMIAGYLCGRASLNCVFVLIDSRHEPQTIDLEFVGWLLGERVPFALVFSKADKVKPGRVQANIELFQAKIAPWCEELPRVFITSAETRAGRPELLAFIRERVASAAAGE